jgi:hypothetical protein
MRKVVIGLIILLAIAGAVYAVMGRRSAQRAQQAPELPRQGPGRRRGRGAVVPVRGVTLSLPAGGRSPGAREGRACRPAGC